MAYTDKNNGSSPQENSRKNSELQYITDLKSKTLNLGWPQCPSHQLKADFPSPRWLLHISLLILSPTLPPHPTLSCWVSSPFHKENRNWENSHPYSHPVLNHRLKTQPSVHPHRGTSFALYAKANSISCCTEYSLPSSECPSSKCLHLSWPLDRQGQALCELFVGTSWSLLEDWQWPTKTACNQTLSGTKQNGLLRETILWVFWILLALDH